VLTNPCPLPKSIRPTFTMGKVGYIASWCHVRSWGWRSKFRWVNNIPKRVAPPGGAPWHKKSGVGGAEVFSSKIPVPPPVRQAAALLSRENSFLSGFCRLGNTSFRGPQLGGTSFSLLLQGGRESQKRTGERVMPRRYHRSKRASRTYGGFANR
jgi:hypothetical protein